MIVNGQARRLPDGATIAYLVGEMGQADRPRGVAVAVNGEVVPRRAWDERRLDDGDRIEVLTAVSGG